MNVVDLLITIVVVTILVTIVLAIVTYIAYKLRLSREPSRAVDDPDGLRYFVRHDPPAVDLASTTSSLDQLDEDVDTMEGHEAEA